MRPARPADVFRMVCHRDVKGVALHFKRFGVARLHAHARQTQALALQIGHVGRVHLVAVGVALGHHLRTVNAPQFAVQQAHAAAAHARGGSAVVLADAVLRYAHHGMRRQRVRLGGMRVRNAQQAARRLHHRQLHAKADGQEGHAPLARIARRHDHAIHPAVAKAAWRHDGVIAAQQLLRRVRRDFLGVHQIDPRLHAAPRTRVAQRLGHGKVGVRHGGVLAHHRHAKRHGCFVYAVNIGFQGGQVRCAVFQMQLGQHRAGQPLLFQHQRQPAQRVHIHVLNDVGGVDVAEQSDLFLRLASHGLFRAADDHVRLDAGRAQRAHAALRGLGFQLARRGNIGHQRQVDITAVI